MSRVETTAQPLHEPGPLASDVPGRLVVPVVISAIVVTGVLVAIVRASESAWHLLGVGHGLIPPEYYHVSGFVVILATTFGQAVGWAAGSGVTYYVMTLVGFPRRLLTWKLAMSLVYVALGAFPLLVYHVLYGSPLLDLPREGVERWLLGDHPDAYWLLVTAHPWLDGSVVPSGVIFLGLLWLTGDRPRRNALIQTLLALALLLTSLAVALSLGVHSTLAHLRV